MRNDTAICAYGDGSKPVPKSMVQNLTWEMSFDTMVMYMTTTPEQKKRLLKAKIAVALQDETGKVPSKEKVEEVFMLARVMYKAVLGLDYKRKEQKKQGQLAIF
jgi:hypothetical protein